MPSLEWLKHAFAVEAAESVDPTAEQCAVVDRLCREIVRRQLTTPATVFLEMSRPLGFLTAQAIHFFTPMISALTDAQGHRHFAEFLEHPGAIGHLLEQIETIGREGAPRRHGDAEGEHS